MGGGGSSSSTQSSQSEAKTPEQKKRLSEMLALYGPQMGKNEKVWQGERVAPMSGLQQSTIAGAGNYADYFSAPQQAGMPLFGQTGQTTAQLLSGSPGGKPMSDEDVQSYFSEKYYQPAMTSLKRDVLPLVDESYAGPGYFGSARSHGRQEAITDVNERLATQWADLNWNVLQQNQQLEEAKAGRQLSTLQPAMAFSQLPTQNIQANLENAIRQVGGLEELFGLGEKQQSQEQAELEAAMMKFAEELQITSSDDLAIMLTLLGLNFSSSTTKGKSKSAQISIA
jgi:hypothetical protein